jgi:hypothetical protein
MHTKQHPLSSERRSADVNVSTHRCFPTGASDGLQESRWSARRGAKPNPEAVEATRLQKRIAELERKSAKADRVIDVLTFYGKVYALLRVCVGESADGLDLPPESKRSSTWALSLANGKAASNSTFREQVFNGTQNAGHKRHIRSPRRERGRVSAPEPREIWTESMPADASERIGWFGFSSSLADGRVARLGFCSAWIRPPGFKVRRRTRRQGRRAEPQRSVPCSRVRR